MIEFEFEEGVKLTVDRAAGTRNDTCTVYASSKVAAIKGLCWLVEKLAEYLNMSVEEIICRLAVILLGPVAKKGGRNDE